MDIIQWPTMLQEPCFASARAQIEAPYRRKPPTPDEADYRDMGAAVEDMKTASLAAKRRREPHQYKAAKAFVTQLGGEIAKQIK